MMRLPRTSTDRILRSSSSRSRHSGKGWMAPILTPDRKSTRLNSSHLGISYAVFCLKKQTISLLPTATLFRALWTIPRAADPTPTAQVITVGGRQILSVAVFFNDTATTEIYALSLHDALPI